MKIIKKILGFLLYLVMLIILFLVGLSIWNIICSNNEEKNIKAPGDKIEVYEDEYIHAVKSGIGEYTIVLLPGMGTASPYYDYYKLNESLSQKYATIVMEPLGYGFSDDTDKPRTLENYENELSKVLDYYNVHENIILLGHSYSGISNFNYANKHDEVKGIVCLDCTTAYQIETHVENGTFNEEIPKTPIYYSYVSPLGISRFAYLTFLKSTAKELLEDVPVAYQSAYKHFLYSKTLNKTIINEINDIYQNQLDIFGQYYREDLNVLTILSNETIDEMQQYKNDGDFYHDWEEMHNLLISNPQKQKIYILEGNHYIHHGNVEEISTKIDEMISEIK